VPSRLQQAITLIEAGDKQKGGQLLAELLKANPKNKVAWLWMSSVVQKEVRFSQFTYDALCSGISLFCGALAGAFVGRCFPGLR
jgi:hypothetical protein